MTEETISNLTNWAEKNARIEFERDLLILKARQEGENMSAVARAARLSRTHVYRVADEAGAFFQLLVDDLGSPEAAWEATESASNWRELLG